MKNYTSQLFVIALHKVLGAVYGLRVHLKDSLDPDVDHKFTIVFDFFGNIPMHNSKIIHQIRIIPRVFL